MFLPASQSVHSTCFLLFYFQYVLGWHCTLSAQCCKPNLSKYVLGIRRSNIFIIFGSYQKSLGLRIPHKEFIIDFYTLHYKSRVFNLLKITSMDFFSMATRVMNMNFLKDLFQQKKNIYIKIKLFSQRPQLQMFL